MDLRDRLQATLGNAYTVERELGGGGMSRVFLAHETSLGRYVVVKVLSASVIEGISGERFAREVRLAASLQHPNIVPVLTTGVADGIPYYTMPYVKGESLRARMTAGTLPLRQAISVLRDIARALQYAHADGVVHRDIKPENVLLAGDAAVVTDFGIAKAISAARTGPANELDPHAPTTLTQAGLSVGTPAYMSPEQAAGDDVDHRADIYAWGVLAYEMLSGAHPFERGSAAQMMAAHLSQSPQPLSEKSPAIPYWLADLVMRCLAKLPEQRPSSAREVIEQMDVAHTSQGQPTLPRVKRRFDNTSVVAAGIIIAVMLAAGAYTYSTRSSASSAAAISSVAVLPFDHDETDSTQEYLGEGIAEELMTALGKVPGIRVASRTSSIAVGKRNDLDVREIAERLGVNTVVEGTIRRSGGKLRVTAQLTNASDGLTTWSESYDRDAKDVFVVQDEITQAIIKALRPAAKSTVTSSGPGTSDPEAYDLYMRGLYLIERRGAGVARAADYFGQAIKRDPKFARAYAGLAGALELFPYFTGVPAHVVEPRARAAADRALQLDPSLAEPRVALAMAHWHALRWDDADREFRRAIGADSTSAVAHTQYGRYLISVGRIDDAIGELRTARRLDPLAATSSVWLSVALAYKGDRAAADAESKRSRELDPELLNNRTVLVFDIVRTGRHAEALRIMGDRIPPTPFNGMVAFNLERAGNKTRAAEIRRLLDAMPDTTWVVHTARAWAYLGTGDTAKALSEIEESVERREIIGQNIPLMDWLYDSVRQSPRFAAIIRNLGLEGRGFTSATGGRPAP